MNKIRRLARRAILNTVVNEGVPGKLGQGDGTVRVSDGAGGVRRGLNWARVSQEGKMTEIIVRNTTVPEHADLPVRIALRQGVLTVIGQDGGASFSYTGGQSLLANHWWQHARLGPDPGYITGPAFLPLMARPSKPPDMTVTVESAFYRFGGVSKVWRRGPSPDLSSYVPGGTVLIQHFIVLCLDRDANSLAVVDGVDSGPVATSSVPFDEDDVLDVLADLDDDYFPVAAIRFYSGQTSVRAADIFMDLRLWGGELYGSVGGGSAGGGWVVDYDAIIPANKDAFIPGAVSVQDGATLTVDGELYIL